jgi:hypothetical protein
VITAESAEGRSWPWAPALADRRAALSSEAATEHGYDLLRTLGDAGSSRSAAE